jgi:hypothetical protein
LTFFPWCICVVVVVAVAVAVAVAVVVVVVVVEHLIFNQDTRLYCLSNMIPSFRFH